MYEPNPITPLGTVWIALYAATEAKDIPSATPNEVFEAQNTPHPLDKNEVENILYDLWEQRMIDLHDVAPGGTLLYRFPSPTYATP